MVEQSTPSMEKKNWPKRTLIAFALGVVLGVASALAFQQNLGGSSSVFQQNLDGSFSFEGEGNTVTEPFELEAGKHTIQAEYASANSDELEFRVVIINLDDPGNVPKVERRNLREGIMFSDFYTGRDKASQEYAKADVIEIETAATYLFEVESSGPWSLKIH